MTDLKAAIISYLGGVAGVTGLVGSSPVRIGSNQASGGWRGQAYIVLRRIGGDHERHLRGAAGLASADIEFTCFGRTSLESEQIAEALRLALDGKFGLTMASVQVRSVGLNTDFDEFTPPLDGGDDGTDATRRVFTFWYVEDTA